METKHDDGVEWLRDIRRRLAKKFDHDPIKGAAHYREPHQHHASRLYQRGESVPAGK